MQWQLLATACISVAAKYEEAAEEHCPKSRLAAVDEAEQRRTHLFHFVREELGLCVTDGDHANSCSCTWLATPV
jgi:hypothetical protein